MVDTSGLYKNTDIPPKKKESKKPIGIQIGQEAPLRKGDHPELMLISDDPLNPDDAEWYDQDALHELKHQTNSRPCAPQKRKQPKSNTEELLKADQEIMELRVELLLLQDKLAKKKDYNAFMIWLATVDPKEYPLYDGILKRIKTFKRTSFVKDILGLLQIWEGL